MRDLPNITYRVGRHADKKELDDVVVKTWATYKPMIETLLPYEDAELASSFLRIWVEFCFHHHKSEGDTWTEYFLNSQFPNFVVHACLHVS